jgi:C4-dicarboxylate-specific signal transduction histidine kinase
MKVILDVDLAAVYGVSVKRLNEQVKRNKGRFPEDFMFQLEDHEVSILRSQFATAKWTMRRTNPYAFTEHGAVMAANVLNSQVAIDASILLVRSFIKMRMIVSEHTELKRRLNEIERRLAQGFAQHEQELQEIRFLISQLENPLDPKKRKIGFLNEGEG